MIHGIRENNVIEWKVHTEQVMECNYTGSDHSTCIFIELRICFFTERLSKPDQRFANNYTTDDKETLTPHFSLTKAIRFFSEDFQQRKMCGEAFPFFFFLPEIIK